LHPPAIGQAQISEETNQAGPDLLADRSPAALAFLDGLDRSETGAFNRAAFALLKIHAQKVRSFLHHCFVGGQILSISVLRIYSGKAQQKCRCPDESGSIRNCGSLAGSHLRHERPDHTLHPGARVASGLTVLARDAVRFHQGNLEDTWIPPIRKLWRWRCLFF
jgi:hypothetical protein